MVEQKVRRELYQIDPEKYSYDATYSLNEVDDTTLFRLLNRFLRLYDEESKGLINLNRETNIRFANQTDFSQTIEIIKNTLLSNHLEKLSSELKGEGK